MFSPIDDLTLGISFTQTLRLYDGITNNQVFELPVCMDNIYNSLILFLRCHLAQMENRLP